MSDYLTTSTVGTLLPASTPTQNVYRKVFWHIMPFIVLCYIIAYLDRVNVGFAKLQMSSDLHFSDATYGAGAGVFFIAYFLLEVPSNLILHRVGARRWLARILISWGVVSACTMFVRSPVEFYLARFMLGLAEAGFSPGVMLYLTYWFPQRKRGFALGFYYIAIPLAGVIGGPLSGTIMHGFAHSTLLAGWQWLFLLEAIPAIVAGVGAYALLIDRPEKASWLSPHEKRLITDELAEESAIQVEHATVRQFLRDSRLWKLVPVYFMQIVGLYGLSFWLPSIIAHSGVKDIDMVGWLSAIPYLVAIPVIILTGITADRTGARRHHFAAMIVLGAAGLAMSGYVAHGPAMVVACLSIAAAGTLSSLSLFWGVPMTFLAGTSAAAGIAMINSIGNLAGFASPFAVGWLNVLTGDPRVGLGAVAICMLLGAALIYLSRDTGGPGRAAA